MLEDELKRIKKEIKILTLKMKNESDLNRQYEISRQIQDLNAKE